MRCCPAAWLGVVLAAACGPATPAAAPAADVPLTIPVTADARAALAQLSDRAATDPDAAWERLHYLLDLFDDARFRADDDSLRLLTVALGDEVTDPPLRGPLRTDLVIAGLRTELDAVAGRDPDRAAVADARVLLDLDAGWPQRRAEVPQALAPVVRLAGSDSPLAGNAALRLAGYCAAALRDAIRAAPTRRAAILGHCLYAFGRPGEAAPHFAEGAPAPALDPILTRLEALLAIAATDPRLRPAAERQERLLTSLIERHRSALDDQGEDLDGGAGGTGDPDP